MGQEDAVGIQALHGWSPDQADGKRKEAIRKLMKEHGCERVIKDLQIVAGGDAPGSLMRKIGMADARWMKVQPECRKANRT